MANRISLKKLRVLHGLFIKSEINISGTARALKSSKITIRKYFSVLRLFKTQFPDDINHFNRFISFLKKLNKDSERPSEQQTRMSSIFQQVHDSIVNSNSNRKIEWEKFITKFPDGYRYTQFTYLFSKWLNENNLNIGTKRWKIKSIPEEDLITLNRWRLSTDRRKWEKSVVVLDVLNGEPISRTAFKVERSRRKIKEWLKSFEKEGLKGLQTDKKKKVNKKIIKNIETKKSNLVKMIHETPKNFGINRASWSLETLKYAYKQTYGITISNSMISEYIKSLGYGFRKAKKVLTSPDPNYREKLQHITKILSGLTNKQKFFSVDEFGPFAIKIKGGTSIVKLGEVKTYPQWQKSKGSLICTAALELSHNQITHFYSSKKNTDEMIKLLDLLLVKYKDEEKIYFSWDAASWHASKKLNDKIDEVNQEEYRNINKTPLVELAPLPSSAQFLNVIESVFSGMSKGIIHSSDYQSPDECKSAIDKYFNDRNVYFQKYPKRAGKKIWGKEINKPIFDETKNFKDSKWR